MSNVPPFLQALYDNDRELYDQVMQGMELIHAEAGAVPLKYRLLFSMVADGVLFHPHGVTAMAKAARAAGATDARSTKPCALSICRRYGGAGQQPGRL